MTRPPPPAAPLTPVEVQVADLLHRYRAGDLDHAWDVVWTVMTLANQLPPTSPLYEPFNRMYGEIEDLCKQG